jgi:hypothetical protein
MKQLIFILFFATTMFYTEGGRAQGVFEKKDIQPPPAPDSAGYYDYNETDTIGNTDILPIKKQAKSPYTEAQKKYLAQPLESKNIDKNNWERAKAGIDYSSDKLKKEATKTPTSFNPAWGVLFEFLKWFFIIGAVVLLAYLILRFVGEGNIFGIKKRRISDPSVQIDLEHIEENLETADLDPLIRQAIADKNYALAVRLYYLAILKELHLKGAIDWKKDKTNRIYLREMRENPFFESFKNTTSVFERVWYGSQTIDERGFEIIQPDFQSLLKSIK